MPPTWLTIIAWISIAAAFVSAAAILYDIYGRGLRQHVRVMEAVWPITALYLGPLGLLAYARIGRPRLVSATNHPGGEDEPEWHGVFISPLTAALVAPSVTSSASGPYSPPR